MAQTGNTLPYFPNPPREYEQRYLAEVIKAFSLFMRQSQNPGQERATNIVLTSLQQNEYGLEPGTVFVVDGQLRIPVLNSHTSLVSRRLVSLDRCRSQQRKSSMELFCASVVV